MCIRDSISGIGLNLLATAASTLLMQIIWGNKGNSEAVASVNTKLTFLKDVPVLGDIFKMCIRDRLYPGNLDPQRQRNGLQ